MLTIQKLGAGTARNYFQEEFSHASNSYYAQNGSVFGRWQGELAAKLGLSGQVKEEQYRRLIEGQHPLTGEQLIHHRDTQRTREGVEASHTPAWDVGVGLPKSWSIAAIVGGDQRLFTIAEQANREALQVLETYAQARGGGDNPHSTTSAFVAATFRHETARPVNGYSAPQIHFHNLVMNLQQVDGKYRALYSGEIYKAKSYAMQAFFDSLARQGRAAGYQIDWAEGTYAPEIRGISPAYRDHESDREKLILAEMQRLGVEGGKAAHEIAKYNREDKLKLSPAEFITAQKEHGQRFAEELQVVPEALARGPVILERMVTAQQAVTHAQRSLSERLATFEHYQLGREALRYSLGTVSREVIEAEIARRIDTGELVKIHHYREYAPGARYTTQETLRLERETVERVLQGRSSVPPILENADLSRYQQLADNRPRQQIIKDILATRDQVVALNWAAGSAKSTAAGILRELAEAQGYRVKGLAPTGTATAALREKGIASDTLQMHLTQTSSGQASGQRTLYIVDETSLASTKAIHAFLQTLQPEDHVLLVGDDASDPRKVGQHTSVEAGRVFQLLQEAGMKTAHFNRIYRQKDPDLKHVVLRFRYGQTEQALGLLASQGRMQEHSNSRDRYTAIARAYAESPQGTLVVSPDNESRRHLNAAIRNEMRQQGILGKQTYSLAILVGRDVTGTDLKRASSYRIGDVLQYRKGNQAVGVHAKEYATVIDRNTDNNRITVKTQDGRLVTYDPARAAGVNAFETRQQEFSAGERIQFTAKDKKLGTYTRDLATIRSVEETGQVEVVLDRNQKVLQFNLQNHRHLDHGYTLTSHSSQSQTVERVLIHINTSDPRLRGLLHEVFGYVAASRPEHDLRLFVDQAAALERVLGREHEQHTALAPPQIRAYRQQEPAPLSLSQESERRPGGERER